MKTPRHKFPDHLNYVSPEETNSAELEASSTIKFKEDRIHKYYDRIRAAEERIANRAYFNHRRLNRKASENMAEGRLLAKRSLTEVPADEQGGEGRKRIKLYGSLANIVKSEDLPPDRQ